MKKIRFGIIGLGRQGLRLAEHIRSDIEPGKLVAVCRRTKGTYEYSQEHGIKFYSNYHDLLDDKEIDAVIITTPSNLHGIHALDALKAKKHLLIDKPIASTLAEGKKILALSKEKGLTVALNFPLRVSPVSEAIRNNLDRIGKLIKIQVVVSHGPVRSLWQSDLKLSNGGVILDLGSHYFDLISFLTRCQPKTIDNAYSEEHENEHSGFIDVAYKDFSVSIVMLRNQKLKKNIITFAGEKGFIFADYSLKEVIVSNYHEINEIKCPENYGFKIILDNLVDAINKKDEIIATAEDGINSLKAVLDVYEKIKKQDTVRI